MLRLPISTLAFQVHMIAASNSLGRSQKYLFVFAQILYGLLLHSPWLQNISFLGLWVLLVLEGILSFEPLDLWCMPGKLTRRKRRLWGQHDMYLISRMKNLPFATCFLWVFHFISRQSISPFITKMILSHQKDVSIFDSQSLCILMVCIYICASLNTILQLIL